jgi:diacylglycerol O-acyltransferase
LLAAGPERTLGAPGTVSRPGRQKEEPMQQLTGMDATFLHMETPSTQGHVGSLTIFDAEGASSDFGFEQIKGILEERLHLAPPLRRRLVEVPFGIDQPYWIEDPDFDLDYHVREIALPPPGNERQLADQVARIHERPLDRSRPLWELYVIWGLADGHVAQYTKIHHSAIDGVSGAELLAVLLDIEPEPRKVEPPSEPWQPDAEPSQIDMLRRGILTMLTQPLKALRFQRRTLQTMGRRDVGSQALTAILPVTANLCAVGLAVVDRVVSSRLPKPVNKEGELMERPTLKAPRTTFNRMITPHRRFAFGSLSLDTAKHVKNTFGVTVNDVILAVCGGALRHYLSERDELPDAALLAMVPVSVRTDGQQGAMGNQVSAIITTLATDDADPVQRLRTIHDSMLVAKEQNKAIPAELLQDYGQFATPALAARASRAIARTKVASLVTPPFNVTISNIPGPNFPLYGAGARLVGTYPVSAIADGIGLNITVMSYMGDLDFGIVACRDMMPDAWPLIDDLRDALDDLNKAASA